MKFWPVLNNGPISTPIWYKTAPDRVVQTVIAGMQAIPTTFVKSVDKNCSRSAFCCWKVFQNLLWPGRSLRPSIRSFMLGWSISTIDLSILLSSKEYGFML